jgi:glycerol-3-phosphate acyltransferase PlsY
MEPWISHDAQRPGAFVANSADMHRAVRLAASAALGYAIGSIPSCVLVGRLSRGIDVREHGSHSMGMANVLRTAGRGPAAVTLALDIGKGAAAARLGEALGGGRGGGAAAGLGAVIGHSWPIFVGFRGGKSSATLFGAVSVITPPVAGVSLITGVGALAVTRRTSMLSLSGSIAGGLAALAFGLRRRDAAGLALTLPGVAVVIFRHRENIDRLIRGVEPAVGDPETPPTA